MQAVLTRLTYRPGWRFETYEDPSGAVVLRFGCWEPNSEKPGEEIEVVYTDTRPRAEWQHWTERQLLTWIRDVVRTRLLHEMDEWLRLDGVPLREPHPEKGWNRNALERAP